MDICIEVFLKLNNYEELQILKTLTVALDLVFAKKIFVIIACSIKRPHQNSSWTILVKIDLHVQSIVATGENGTLS